MSVTKNSGIETTSQTKLKDRSVMVQNITKSKKPANVILDVKEMLSRQRVSSFLSNQQFCNEMKQLVSQQFELQSNGNNILPTGRKSDTFESYINQTSFKFPQEKRKKKKEKRKKKKEKMYQSASTEHKPFNLEGCNSLYVDDLSSVRLVSHANGTRSGNYANINFMDKNCALKAMHNLNYETLKKKSMRIMWSFRDPSIRKNGVGNIFIKNLDKIVDQKTLFQTFSHFGPIMSCKQFGPCYTAMIRLNGTRLTKDTKPVEVMEFIPRSKRILEDLIMYDKKIIYDVRPMENEFTKFEKITRAKLASVYRLLYLYGWNSDIDSHATARINFEKEEFLIRSSNEFCHSVSAKSLFKINRQGKVVDESNSNTGLNHLAIEDNSFFLHSIFYSCRPDIKCVIHVRTDETLLISALKCGLKPLCRYACVVNISYVDSLLTVLDKEQESLDRFNQQIGSNTNACFIKNDGLLVFASSIEKTFYILKRLMVACQVQVKALPFDKISSNLKLIDQTTADNIAIHDFGTSDYVYKNLTDGMVNVKGGSNVFNDTYVELINSNLENADANGSNVSSLFNVNCINECLVNRKLRISKFDFEFESLMKRLDDLGYRTGYPYIMRTNYASNQNKSICDVSIPPASISFNESVDKSIIKDKNNYIKRNWMASPNAYDKIKKKTAIPGHSAQWTKTDEETTVVQVPNDKPNQFAPQGKNPEEFLEMHNNIKNNYYTENVNSGPESKIMHTTKISQNQDYSTIGSVSRGLIQSKYRDNPEVYTNTVYKNPFNEQLDKDLDFYKLDISESNKKDSLKANDVFISNEENNNKSNHTYEEVGNVKSSSVRTEPRKSINFENNITNETKQKHNSEKPKKKRFRTPSFMKRKRQEKPI
ncbi:Adducin-like protein 70 [Intoshia linei]|uniref:Adducin-like protein 70 n=1 Tax=Intoshia linei TaxID=1819745 RepID=A0A177B868_9BILA|nr:Adducin-like protein 70 [Intoshia linei]